MSSPETLPRQLGRYVLTQMLGQGAMGSVYKAHDPIIDRAVAIKLVRAELLDPDTRDEFLQRFRLEARSAGRCTHPNIVAVYDFSDDATAPHIVMEFVEGETLQQRLRRGPLPTPDEAMAIMLQVLDALDYAHEQNIVHRDVKPANIIALKGGRVKLMDFGIARMNDTGLTQAGMMIGTLRYMAPEQAAGLPIDRRADLFSAAVVFHEMLTGAVPFPGANATEILLKLAGPAPAELKLSGPLARFEPALRRALAKPPAERFDSAADFAAALRGAPVAELARPDDDAPDDDATVFVPQPSRMPTPAPALEPAALDPELVASAEKMLATVLGPISRVLVQKAAASSKNANEFLTRVASGIPQDAARQQFLEETVIRKPAEPPVQQAPAAALPDEALAAAQRLIASYIGPIAKMVTRSAAQGGPSWEDFAQRLATHLTRAEDQAQFRKRFKAEVEDKFRR